MGLPDERSSQAGAPADLTVDFTGLAHLVTQLRELSRGLAAAGELSAGFADRELAQALRHAEQDWREHRRRLGSFLDGAADGLQSGLLAYRQVEDDLTRAARPR